MWLNRVCYWLDCSNSIFNAIFNDDLKMTQNTIFPPEVSHIHNGGDFHIILKRLYECIARKIILKQLFFSGLLLIWRLVRKSTVWTKDFSKRIALSFHILFIGCTRRWRTILILKIQAFVTKRLWWLDNPVIFVCAHYNWPPAQ